MQLPPTDTISCLLLRVACLALPLWVSSCGESTPLVPPREQREMRRFIYVPPPARVATSLPENFSQWTKILGLQHQEMQELQAKLTTHQEIHLTNQFDDFLSVTLDGLPAEQLASLWHFADKGYFTVERRIIKRLLTDRLAENDPHLSPSRGADIGERAALLARQNELKLRDLRTAAELYTEVNKGEFHIPTPVNTEQLDALRSLTTSRLAKTKEEIAALDLEIGRLRDALNAESAK